MAVNKRLDKLIKEVSGFSQGRDSTPYKLDKKRIVTDLKEDRPLYILSAYAPERELPIQLFGGYPREQSFEELRLRHYELAATGNAQQAVQEAQGWFNSAEQQIRTALNDVEGAIKFMINGENEHPNRIDICKSKGGAHPVSVGSQSLSQGSGQPSSTLNKPGLSTGEQSTPFGQPRTSIGFGQPSTIGSRPSPFGQPVPASSNPSSFGQPTQLGQSQATFGQPSASFGQTSAQAPAFGKASNPLSTFGQTSVPTSGFSQTSMGQPSAPPLFAQRPTPAFGTPSTLASNQKSPFGQLPTQTQTSTFGQPAAPSQPTGFGQPSTATANPFGQPSQPARNSSSGTTSTAANPFGKPATSQPISTFGQSATSANSLGQASTQAPSAMMQPTNGPGNEFGQRAAPSSAMGAKQGAALQSTNGNAQVPATRDAQGKLQTWRGMPITYIDNEPCFRAGDGAWEKVSFPDGPPVLSKAIEVPDSAYDQRTIDSYQHMRQHGMFKDGIMPTLAPKRAWCKWDF
ncbi:MAG: hypothetical protein Q9191_000981 [Dirinaria sp. TL-2023a]